MAAYSRTAGVSATTLSRWIQAYPLAAPAFVDVTPVADDVPAVDSGDASVFPVRVAGCDLSFAEPPPASWFAAVLRAATSC